MKQQFEREFFAYGTKLVIRMHKGRGSAAASGGSLRGGHDAQRQGTADEGHKDSRSNGKQIYRLLIVLKLLPGRLYTDRAG